LTFHDQAVQSKAHATAAFKESRGDRLRRGTLKNSRSSRIAFTPARIA
jgi:hypothetical protein